LIDEINIWIKDYVDKWLLKYYRALANSLIKSAYPSGEQLSLAAKVAVVESSLQKQPVSIN